MRGAVSDAAHADAVSVSCERFDIGTVLGEGHGAWEGDRHREPIDGRAGASESAEFSCPALDARDDGDARLRNALRRRGLRLARKVALRLCKPSSNLTGPKQHVRSSRERRNPS